MVYTSIFTVPIDQSYNDRKTSILSDNDEEYFLITNEEINNYIHHTITLSRASSISMRHGKLSEDIFRKESNLKESKLKDIYDIWPLVEIQSKFKKGEKEKISNVIQDNWRNSLCSLKVNCDEEIKNKVNSCSPEIKKFKFSEMLRDKSKLSETKASSVLSNVNSHQFCPNIQGKRLF